MEGVCSHFCVDIIKMLLEAWSSCESLRIPMAFPDSSCLLRLFSGLISYELKMRLNLMTNFITGKCHPV